MAAPLSLGLSQGHPGATQSLGLAGHGLDLALAILRLGGNPQEISAYMYLRWIIIEDIRGFRMLDFDLAGVSGGFSGWTVMTGDNASGKTALLKAVALAIV